MPTALCALTWLATAYAREAAFHISRPWTMTSSPFTRSDVSDVETICADGGRATMSL